jgi:hypothetical protein
MTTRGPSETVYEPPTAKNGRRPCRCGVCSQCQQNARWERIFQEKFADPQLLLPAPAVGLVTELVTTRHAEFQPAGEAPHPSLANWPSALSVMRLHYKVNLTYAWFIVTMALIRLLAVPTRRLVEKPGRPAREPRPFSGPLAAGGRALPAGARQVRGGTDDRLLSEPYATQSVTSSYGLHRRGFRSAYPCPRAASNGSRPQSSPSPRPARSGRPSGFLCW